MTMTMISGDEMMRCTSPVTRGECEHIGDKHYDFGNCRFCDECIEFRPKREDMGVLTLEEAEAIVGGPAQDWAARCFEIAHKLAERVEGVAVYGHWVGPVAPESHFISRAVGFVQHGWVEVDEDLVVDPTRWVFEAVKPYIYIGEPDHYDRGGNRLREAMLRPPPPPDQEEEDLKLMLDGEAREHVSVLLAQAQQITWPQAMWLANLPVDMLAPHAGDVYAALGAADLRGLVPLDNWRMIMGMDEDDA